MHRFKAISTRVHPRPTYVQPKDRLKQWTILRGDKVGIIAGRDKDTIGEVKSVNRDNNTIIVEGKKLSKKHVAHQPSAPDGIVRIEQPIHVSNVMLLHPDTQIPTRIDRRKIEKTLEDGRSVSQWARFVKGTDIEIPKPKPVYNNRGHDEQFSTLPEHVSQVTWTASYDAPPFPVEVLKDLRNPYKK
ncbi:translation protein SH3-like domain-containing protein [Spinellus fusiger]|nr:translation protein SH3-like domain-containing protein [Spinellus fusiger]